MPNRTEARPAKAVLTYVTGRLPLLRLFSTPLIGFRAGQFPTERKRLTSTTMSGFILGVRSSERDLLISTAGKRSPGKWTQHANQRPRLTTAVFPQAHKVRCAQVEAYP
jgi:hypothetical protein